MPRPRTPRAQFGVTIGPADASPAGGLTCIVDRVVDVAVRGRRVPARRVWGWVLVRQGRVCSCDRCRWTRAASSSGSAGPRRIRDITSSPQVSEDYVRDVIHAFNERGGGGRRCKIGDRIPEGICLIARTSPRAEYGLTGFSTWSLTKLRGPPPSQEHRRRTLSWDAAPDPARQRDLVADHHNVEGFSQPGLHHQDTPDPHPLRPPTHQPTGELCASDESGPLNLLPRKGQDQATPPQTEEAAGDLSPLRPG
jgi:hypothetical protein